MPEKKKTKPNQKPSLLSQVDSSINLPIVSVYMLGACSPLMMTVS